MILDGVDLNILGPAFLAGLLVLATHVPLGDRVLARGIIFLDLAVAQIAGLGAIAAHSFGIEPSGWQAQLAAGAGALAGALLLHEAERRWPEVQEAIIGSAFVLAASASVLLLAANPHGGEHLKDLLVGQILWVGYRDLIPAAVLYTAILAVWFSLRERLTPLVFYILFALAVTVSVQLVGIYLVFASLIMPALAVRRFRAELRLPLGYAIGAAGYVAGLMLSTLFDLPAGATIVGSLAAVATLAVIVPTGVTKNV